MAPSNNADTTTRFLIVLIATLLAIAAMRTAQALVVPILLALFGALAAHPVVKWLQDKGLPTWGAVIVTVIAMVVAVGFLGFLAGTSVKDFSEKVPGYRKQLSTQVQKAGKMLGERGQDAVQDVVEAFDPGKAMQLAAGLLNGVSGILADAFLIVFAMILMLFELSDLPAKLRLAIPDSRAVVDYFRAVTLSLKKYLVIKTLISLATGVCVGLFVGIMGIDFPVLWGLLAFMLNFIPSIGSILAAIPAVMMALVQFGPAKALLVAAGYLVINIVFGNVIEPQVTGQGVGLATLAVFVSLLFWGWVLGSVGMLLSVPLTMTIKIALERHPRTQWIAVLLGPAPPPRPASSQP